MRPSPLLVRYELDASHWTFACRLGAFYRGPGARFSQAAADFFQQVPSQSPGAVAAAAATIRAGLATRVYLAGIEERNAALAMDAADLFYDLDGIAIVVGAIVK